MSIDGLAVGAWGRIVRGEGGQRDFLKSVIRVKDEEVPSDAPLHDDEVSASSGPADVHNGRTVGASAFEMAPQPSIVLGIPGFGRLDANPGECLCVARDQGAISAGGVQSGTGVVESVLVGFGVEDHAPGGSLAEIAPAHGAHDRGNAGRTTG